MNFKNSVSDTKLKMIHLEREMKRMENSNRGEELHRLHERLITINREIDQLIFDANKSTGRIRGEFPLR